MFSKTFSFDPRWFQVLFQSIFLLYGLVFLDWQADYRHYIISITGCLFFNYTAESSKMKQWLPIAGEKGFSRWGFSVLISAMSLCLLLKTNHWYTSLLAAFLSVLPKYMFRYKGKHIWNPSAFGIAATILISGDAWLSPSQWGSNITIFFFVVTLGVIVVTRVQKLDISLAFLLTYIGLLFWRQVYVLGWPLDHFIHSISTGSLLLFSFFMISDPKTAPNHPVARIIWACLIAFTAFYFSAFQWKYNTPIWMLVIAAPLVPIFNFIFKASSFQWKSNKFSLSHFPILKSIVMKNKMKKTTALFLLAVMISYDVSAFCGFYVSKADGTLKNKTSQVIIVRDGNRNVITMYNDFKGKLKDFAMVVPVPVVLKQSDIKVVDQSIFQTLNDYSKPRLVEYYDQNPCQRFLEDRLEGKMAGVAMNEVVVTGYGTIKRKQSTVKIEAKYIVGEYDILILSAKESADLKIWLGENDYKIPAGAEEVLEPYIKSNLKFFVVKVNEQAKKKIAGDFLRPIQITFNSPKFMLPIRLGMANADGDQDMIVYAFTKKGRIETTNYRTTELPTGNNIPLFVKQNFGNFYSNLFQYQWSKEGQSVAMLEYAWDVSPSNYVKCDPCVATAPSKQDLAQAGVWWVKGVSNDFNSDESEDFNSDKTFFTRLHVRYNRKSFPQDLMFQVTANQQTYQARYVITHPATGDFNCDAGKRYVESLKQRRKDELVMLQYLTGKTYDDWDVVAKTELEVVPKTATYASVNANEPLKKRETGILIATIAVVATISVAGISRMKS